MKDERNILFQGRTPGGEFVEGFYVERYGKSYISLYGDETEIVPGSVRQYTGLRDGKGNRIFEGDILKYERDGKTFEGVVTYGVMNSTQTGYSVRWRKDDTFGVFRTDIGFWAKRPGVTFDGNVHDEQTG